MPLFSRSRQALGPDQLDGLSDHLQRSRRTVSTSLLAVGRGEQAVVACLRDLFAVHQDDGWSTWPWQQIQDGGWTGETETLTFRLLDGERHRIQLTDPGQVPSVFAERVQSSILVEERVRVPGGEVIVSGRRAPVAAEDPTTPSPVVWHVLSVGRVDLNAPGVADAALRATQRLQADYEI